MDWRFAYASVAGRSHVEAGTVCQDFSLCSVVGTGADAALLLTVSDGAGSAKRSEVGSRLACATFHLAISEVLSKCGVQSPVTREQIENWLANFQEEIAAEAIVLDVPKRDLACTFVGAVVAGPWASFCQIGDGGIVISRVPDLDSGADGEDFEVVFWPEAGEYANETYFATLPLAHEHLQFRILERQVSDLAVFSDGLQRLALRFDTREAFAPFFRNLLRPIRACTGLGEVGALSNRLADFLSSEQVSERTEDDVTLILASQQASARESDSHAVAQEPSTTLQPAPADLQET